MEKSAETSLVIREHDFQAAKNSLKKYTQRAKRDIEINRVSTSGGFLNLGDHTVKGTELNTITSQIQSYLVEVNKLNQGLVDEFDQVYKAFESLDKDYISSIVRSIQIAEKVSLDEQEDRAKIKELVENLDIAVGALKKFKTDIEKLKHLMDVDATYELIERQEELIKALSDYKKELSSLEHLKDVDQLWDAQAAQGESLENIDKQLDSMSQLIADQGDAISEFTAFASELDQRHRSFIESTNKTLNEKQATIDRRFDSREKTMQKDFSDLQAIVTKAQEGQDEKINYLFTTQADKLSSIEKAQAEKLEQIAETQSTALNAMKNEQADHIARMASEQTESLAQISREQVEWLESTNKSLEEEKTSLKETVSILTQKVKTAYIVAGGTAVVAMVHMVLNVLGVL